MASVRIRWKVQRDNFTCRYCGRSSPDVALEVDHVVPVSRRGSDHMSNLVTACWECNRGKVADDASEPLFFLDWVDSLRADVAVLDLWVDSLKQDRHELGGELGDAREEIAYLRHALEAAELGYKSEPTHISELLWRRAS